MKKFIATLSITTLLIGGIFFVQPTSTSAIEVEPPILSVNKLDVQ